MKRKLKQPNYQCSVAKVLTALVQKKDQYDKAPFIMLLEELAPKWGQG